ncbi:hypothetical protein CLOSTASPAR_03947 [[Clostridium] asparagiforme DSM 15981]|uniref:Uncharacterized protein n=1 Tax=[Clostridium] asparagiforme DSM 15981 TaxID=518636 RepID=C0D3V6_9FIRM|nr:hypothetical protein CLOSTASPAR_03947 [[Clostridium] asparagiforme DSM 15981]
MQGLGSCGMTAQSFDVFIIKQSCTEVQLNIFNIYQLKVDII